MSRVSLLVPAAALAVFALFGAIHDGHAELACHTYAGNTVCTGPGALSCQTVNGKTICMQSRSPCETAGGKRDCADDEDDAPDMSADDPEGGDGDRPVDHPKRPSDLDMRD